MSNTLHVCIINRVLLEERGKLSMLDSKNKNGRLTSRSTSELQREELRKSWTRQVPEKLLSSRAATYSPLGIKNGKLRRCILLVDFKKFQR